MNEDDVAKYSWEFLRRNKEYKKAWDALAAETQKASYSDAIEYHLIYPKEAAGKNEAEAKSLYEKHSQIWSEERVFTHKWGVVPTDPNLSYDELLKRGLEYRVVYSPIKVEHQRVEDMLTLTVYLNVPKERIIKAFKRIIDFAHAFYHVVDKGEEVESTKSRRLRIDKYETYLKVYDLKAAGKSYEQIGAELFDHHDIDEPKQRAVDAHKAASNLVENGLP